MVPLLFQQVASTAPAINCVMSEYTDQLFHARALGLANLPLSDRRTDLIGPQVSLCKIVGCCYPVGHDR